MNASGNKTSLDFLSLYEKFGPMVLRRCRYLVKDEETALDCMQDTFLRLLERKDKLKGVCSSLFYTVATSVCLNKIRANKLRSGPQIDEFINIIEDLKSANHEEVIDAPGFERFIFITGDSPFPLDNIIEEVSKAISFNYAPSFDLTIFLPKSTNYFDVLLLK